MKIAQRFASSTRPLPQPFTATATDAEIERFRTQYEQYYKKQYDDTVPGLKAWKCLVGVGAALGLGMSTYATKDCSRDDPDFIMVPVVYTLIGAIGGAFPPLGIIILAHNWTTRHDKEGLFDKV